MRKNKKESKKSISIGLEEESINKLKIIGKREGRSRSGQARHIIRVYLRKYEKENGKIVIEPKSPLP